MSPLAFVLDSDGQAINSLDDYKIMFADGTELGWAHASITSRMLNSCGPVQSSSGAIFQWSLKLDEQSDSDSWRVGTPGYLTGAMANGEGTWFARVLYLDTTPQHKDQPPVIPFLAWTKDTSLAKGFHATNTSGNRVALLANDMQSNLRGIRPYPYKRDLEGGNFAGQYDVMGGDAGYLALDCQFVKVKRLARWIRGDEGRDPSEPYKP
ncbi:hypothetical protein F5Y14DRAFT_383257 [Nemania sp. NC0429]|nr:hypothetical protein F5Y14DRAFT_383257 [Nemania sp. NC0429]